MLLLFLHSVALTTPSATATAARWRVAHVGDIPESEAPIADCFLEGDAVIVAADMVSKNECAALVTAASQTAASYQLSRESTGLDNEGLVRVPTVLAKARAEATKTPCATPLPAEADALVTTLLERIMEFVDDELPTISDALFGGAILPLHTSGALEFSSREPTVNVYGPGGEFLAHKDHQALTVLVPLTSPSSDFDGGGTAFWAQDSRGHRVAPPTLTLRPPAGTCLLFGGHSTHAGTPVISGKRCVLVASFSVQGGKAQRAADAASSRDIYGDLI